ncbi:MAG: peptidoglycan DD-metalloendopeptidase family protein [Myxococcota bacterium]
MTLLWLAVAASAQDYAFPTSAADYGSFYPTAYRDHGGVTDWDCGSITYAGHDGSDFGGGGFTGMDAGRDVTAAADGTVIAMHDGEFDRCTTGNCAGGGGFGNYVYLQHADGKVTIYGHLKQFSVLVGVGDSVVCGQKMGEMGSSGFSTGPHLHFQVETAGTPEDPFDGPCSAPPSYWIAQGVHGGLPDNTCGPPPTCEPVAALACGDHVQSANDAAGSTNATWTYGCTDYVYTGPELSWTLSSPVDTPVTLSLTGLAADLDLYVVGSTGCAGDDCVAASSNPNGDDEAVTFDAAAGVEYVVVVDGWEGAVSGFDLDVACAVTPQETAETGTAPDTAAPPGDDDDDDATLPPGGDDDDDVGGADLVPSQPHVIAAEPGCGCGTGGAPPGLAGLVLLAALHRRRR